MIVDNWLEKKIMNAFHWENKNLLLVISIITEKRFNYYFYLIYTWETSFFWDSGRISLDGKHSLNQLMSQRCVIVDNRIKQDQYDPLFWIIKKNQLAYQPLLHYLIPGYGTKLYLMMRLQFWRSGKDEVTLHYSPAHSNSELLYLLGCHQWVK